MPSSGPGRSLRVVFDTNVLISAWFWEGNESRLIECVEEGTINGYSSTLLFEELRRTLRYPRFSVSEEDVESVCDYYLLLLKMVRPRQTINVMLEDPEDNRVLECAVEAEADYIVSGDHHLLNLSLFRGKKIVGAAELLVILSIT